MRFFQYYIRFLNSSDFFLVCSDDFSVVLGLQFTSTAHAAPSLGTFVTNYDLVALGHYNSVRSSQIGGMCGSLRYAVFEGNWELRS